MIPGILVFCHKVGQFFTRTVLVQLVVVAKNDNGHLNTGKNAEFVGLFEQAALPFEESDGSIPVIFDGLYLDFATAHDCWRGGSD